MTNAINNGLRCRRTLRKHDKPQAGSNEIVVGTVVDYAGIEYHIMQDGSRRLDGKYPNRGWGKTLRRHGIKLRREARETMEDAEAFAGGAA